VFGALTAAPVVGAAERCQRVRLRRLPLGHAGTAAPWPSPRLAGNLLPSPPSSVPGQGPSGGRAPPADSADAVATGGQPDGKNILARPGPVTAWWSTDPGGARRTARPPPRQAGASTFRSGARGREDCGHPRARQATQPSESHILAGRQGSWWCSLSGDGKLSRPPQVLVDEPIRCHAYPYLVPGDGQWIVLSRTPPTPPPPLFPTRGGESRMNRRAVRLVAPARRWRAHRPHAKRMAGTTGVGHHLSSASPWTAGCQ
jgi:hypothetical protein